MDEKITQYQLVSNVRGPQHFQRVFFLGFMSVVSFVVSSWVPSLVLLGLFGFDPRISSTQTTRLRTRGTRWLQYFWRRRRRRGRGFCHHDTAVFSFRQLMFLLFGCLGQILFLLFIADVVIRQRSKRMKWKTFGNQFAKLHASNTVANVIQTRAEEGKKVWQEFGKGLGKVVGKIEKNEKDIQCQCHWQAQLTSKCKNHRRRESQSSMHHPHQIYRETPFCTQTSRNNHTSRTNASLTNNCVRHCFQTLFCPSLDTCHRWQTYPPPRSRCERCIQCCST